MSYYSRLQKALEGALRLPLNDNCKYILISDCHRGVGNSNDNFLKNQTLYIAALQHYFDTGFTYIELGDGDELWENRDLTAIIDAHSSVFQMLTRFYNQNRFYMLYGNHDIIKAKNSHVYEGIILENTAVPNGKSLFLTHGHQADLLNSTLWPFTRFLVRYIWKPLERYGVLDPTSAAKNYSRKRKTEEYLHDFAEQKDVILIAGHTHRPLLAESDLCYCNSGSCVHPYSITCLEIEHMQICLVKWILTVGLDMRLYVTREVLTGPVALT